MKLNNQKAREQISKYIKYNYNKLQVKSGKCRMNFRCHLNSVHEAKKHKHKKIAMCVYFEQENFPIIHFLNYKKGIFTDNTLGQWSNKMEYYFIDWIYEENMWKIDSIFTEFRERLGRKLSWFVRLTSDYRG